MTRLIPLAVLIALTASIATAADSTASAKTLPDTQPLTLEGDLASQMVDGIDRFLLRQIDLAEPRRAKFWKRNIADAEKYRESVKPNRV